jgi:shikimate dehydrogenase
MAAGEGRLRLGLLGCPVAHSLSPAIHRVFLAGSGTMGVYDAVQVEPGDLERVMRRMFDEGLDGLNVTFPHKRRASALCTGLSPEASTTGAVNTLTRGADGWVGANTDVAGFMGAVDALGLEGPFAVIGGGGAASAAVFGLRTAGIPCRVFCRRPGEFGLGGASPVENAAVFAASEGCSTVVNATTLGWSRTDGFPVPVDALAGKAFLDLGYSRGWVWRDSLRSMGVRVFTGETMLVMQAAESFMIWTGIRPDPGPALLAVTGGALGR